MFPFDSQEDEEWEEPDASDIASIIFLHHYGKLQRSKRIAQQTISHSRRPEEVCRLRQGC